MDIPFVLEIVKTIKKAWTKSNRSIPYNVFEAWQMNENDHTKLLLALLRYKDVYGGCPVLYSFLTRFAKGRDKMIHYKRPAEVDILFSPRFDKDSFIDGLITFCVGEKRIAVIIENKIFDAPDQPNQIRKYISHIQHKKNIPLDNIWVFYITGDGNKEVRSSSYNTKDEDKCTNIDNRFVTLSYAEDIVKWLKCDILGLRTYPETLTTVVRNYVDCLEKEFLLDADISQNLTKTLYKSLQLPTKAEKWDSTHTDTLYRFYENVKSLRSAILSGEQQSGFTLADIEPLFDVLRTAIIQTEIMAFKRFETISEEILNEFWSKQWRNEKLGWKARHRGIWGKHGFVQLSLTDQWGGAHLEWCKINVGSMMSDTSYIIELHVENNKSLAQEWRKNLESHSSLLPKDIKIHGTSHVFQYIWPTEDVPLAKMSDDKLRLCLGKLYKEDLKYIFKTLIDNYKKYKA